MRIVYIGIVDFSRHCLREVLKNRGDVVGIVTSKNSSFNSDYCDLTQIARRHNIPIHYCMNVNDRGSVKWIKDRKPDILFCWGWSQLIKAELLSLPPMGVVGVHPALLPQNRGRHPLIWALALGLKKSGLTFFFMDKGADSGPVLSQKRFEITGRDTAGTLYGKIKKLAARQIAEFLPQLVSRNYKTVAQDPEKANYWRKRSVADGLIDWRMDAAAVLNLIRALAKPYPGAQFKYNDKVITVWEAHRYGKKVPSNAEPGKVIFVSGGKPAIKCYDSAIAIDRYDPCVNFVKGEYIK